MTSPTGNNPTRSDKTAGRAGFTLVELLIVMAMLSIVIAVTAPSLSGFFHGRTVDSEARRFLSLTHYGQSRAVSEGVPMQLWVDAQSGAYGLTQEDGYSDNDDKAIDITVDPDLRLEVQDGVRFVRNGRSLAAIHFSPEGDIVNTSFTGVALRQGDRDPIWITQSAEGLSYEISNQNTASKNTR